MFTLPKGYLSSSACDLWESSPNSYREKYYLKMPGFSSPYTDFGKRFAEDIETHPDKYPHIPKYSLAEFPFKWLIKGVPVLGYLDSFEPTTCSILEYKTGVAKQDGWDNVKVRKWKQLPFYATVIRSMFGTYDPLVKLVWLQTEWKEECKEQKFGTKLIRECANVLAFVDTPPVIFERIIEPWELDLMEERILRIATEISTDYSQYLIDKGGK